MKFELGKCYKHSGGRMMKIVGTAQSYIYGLCLIGENIGNTERFQSVGTDTSNAICWHEITEKEWLLDEPTENSPDNAQEGSK